MKTFVAPTKLMRFDKPLIFRFDIEPGGLTETEMVSAFTLRDPSAADWPADHLKGFDQVCREVEAEGQRFLLIHWIDGLECMLAFDASEAYPDAEALILTYRSLRARMLLSRLGDGSEART